MEGDLSGRTVVVTRAEEGDAELSEAFRGVGATVLRLPTVRIGPPEASDELESALERLEAYDWIAFTSRNAVRALGQRGVELPPGLSVAAVGPATAAQAEDAGYRVDLVGHGSGAEALARSLLARGIGEDSKVFFPTSSRGRTELGTVLTGAGVQVDRVIAYETGIRTFDPSSVPELATADFVTFTSPSAVEGWVASMGADPASWMPPSVRYVVIGDTTGSAAEELGLEAVRARVASFDGMVETVLELARSSAS